MANQPFVYPFPRGVDNSQHETTLDGAIVLAGSATVNGEPIAWNSLITGVPYNEGNFLGRGPTLNTGSALVTALSGSGTTVTATGANNFSVGQSVRFKGCTTTLGKLLNGLSFTVATASGSAFTFASTATGSGSGETGLAVSGKPYQMLAFPSQVLKAAVTNISLTSGIVTVTAANHFLPGAQVTFADLSTALGAKMNGLNFIVLNSIGTAFTVATALTGADGSESGTASATNPPQPHSVRFWSAAASGYEYQYDETLGALFVYESGGGTPEGTITAPGLTMDSYTPAGSVAAPDLTMDSYTPAGSVAAPDLTMDSYTPAGSVAAPDLTMDSYTPAGSVAAPDLTMDSYTPAGSVSVTSGIATYTLEAQLSDNTPAIAADEDSNADSGDYVATLSAVATGAYTFVKSLNPDVGRNLCISFEGATGGSVLPTTTAVAVTGTWRGAAQNETINIDFTGVTAIAEAKFRWAYGVKPFDSVSAVTLTNITSAQNGLLIGVGLGSLIGLPHPTATGTQADILKLNIAGADVSTSGTYGAGDTVDIGNNEEAVEVLVVYSGQDLGADFTGTEATLTGSNTAPAFTGTEATLTGSNSAPAFTGTAHTLTGSNSAPAFTGTAHTLTGSNSAPAFTGTAHTLTGSVTAPTFDGTPGTAGAMTPLGAGPYPAGVLADVIKFSARFARGL